MVEKKKVGRPRSNPNAFPPSYKGGYTMLNKQGYVLEYVPWHPNRHKSTSMMFQHRLVLEDKIGRLMTSLEVVHHVDGDTQNNHPDNLVLTTRRKHLKDHHPGVFLADLPEKKVKQALRGRTTLEAAETLGVNHQTLRNRFPHLLTTRRSPATKQNLRHVLKQIRAAAKDTTIGYREFASQTGICADYVKSLCEKHGIVWLNKVRTDFSKGPRKKPSLKKLKHGG